MTTANIKPGCLINVNLNINCRGYNQDTESKIIERLISNLALIVKDEVSKVILTNGRNLHKDDICIEGRIINCK